MKTHSVFNEIEKSVAKRKRYSDEPIPENTPMKDFYRGKSVFLTGGTGFLGQLFVEKLLRTNVKEIYVLARSKKGVPAIERLSAVYSGPIFHRLSKIDPDYMERIKVIDGNLLDLNIGISNKDYSELIENVEIVIHSAADVRFDETLQHLLLCNLRGTREILKLAEKMKKLVVVMHISTAYSHCPKMEIDEKFYQAPVDPEYMIKLVETLNDSNKHAFEILTEKIIHPWPNTYTYTKALSEELIKNYGQRIPIAVIRPSIVIATYEDPIPGWINNIYGLTGVLVSTGLGFQRILPFKEDLIGDIVCADFVINSTLAVAWVTHEEQKQILDNSEINEHRPEPKIYHMTSYTDRPVTYREIASSIEAAFYEIPSERLLWLPLVNTTNYAILKFIYTILYHILPAIVLDVYFKLINSKIRLMPMYRKVQKFMDANTYFMVRQWAFSNNVMKTVWAKMSADDQSYFPCDIRKYNFIEYSRTYYLGMRAYITHDNEFNLAKAQAKVKKLKVAHFIVLIIYYGGFAYFYFTLFRFLGVFNYFKNFVYDLNEIK